MKFIYSKKIICIISLFFSLFIYPYATFAQSDLDITGRSYDYQSINADIVIQKDTSIDISESETFNFKGTFNQGERIIPFKKLDYISDIEVWDGNTNQKLIYSPRKLDKLNPASWGYYTYYSSLGKEYIDWYYNESNTQYTWILKYKVHGAITFGTQEDRLYWNIFSAFTVPIHQSTVTVKLPQNYTSSKIKTFAYRTTPSKVTAIYDVNNSTAQFSSNDFFADEAFTVDLSWPKGALDYSVYWIDFLKSKALYILGIAICLGALIYGIIFWLQKEKIPESQRTIIPEYQPPENLLPAIAEVITKETITDKGLTATIIDLAIRGYIKIEEDSSTDFLMVIGRYSSYIFIPIFIIFLFWNFTPDMNIGFNLFFLILFFIGLSYMRKIPNLISLLFKSPKDYTLHLLKADFPLDKNLKSYERDLLIALFSTDSTFSTRTARYAGNMYKKELHDNLETVKKEILEETEFDTNAYTVTPIKERTKGMIIFGLIIFVYILLQFGPFYLSIDFQYLFLIAMIVLSLGGLYAFIKFDARLNESGRILKSEWLGFKLYLEVAEKQTMQNLTPDLFEKYLPYAIIFGVEDKWARAFKQIQLTAPNWYTGGAVSSSSGFSGGGSFSATAFSASFTSSFAASFASSGATGSAGGGGAGGGGGGGGGGAS